MGEGLVRQTLGSLGTREQQQMAQQVSCAQGKRPEESSGGTQAGRAVQDRAEEAEPVPLVTGGQ